MLATPTGKSCLRPMARITDNSQIHELVAFYSEIGYREGKKSGTAKYWYENGKVRLTSEYANDKIRSSREYSNEGKLIESVEYEEDGSKKIREE